MFLIINCCPRHTFWLASRLIQIGYLDKAFDLVKQTKQNIKEHDNSIKNRIMSMNEVRNNGFEIDKIEKKTIEKTNVLFAVHNSFPYEKAGYAIRTHSIVTNLKKNNFNAMVATRAGYPWDLQKHREIDSKIKIDKIDNVKYIRLADTNKTFKKGADLDYIETYSGELVKVCKKYNSTILHAHSNYLNAYSAIKASNELKIPSIYEIRGIWHYTRLTVDENYRYNGMFDYEQEMVKGAAISADAVVTISHALKDLISSWGVDEKKITVIPNAVDTKLFTPQLKSTSLIEKYNLENRTIVGFIGSITAYEGLEYLISAVDDLINEGYNLSLLIVGDGKEKKRFEKLAKSKQIIFTGRISHSKVEEYYSLFDMCAYPRNNHEVCQYVSPLKPLEAMAMKKAVIVSDMAPLLEMVKDRHTGLVCLSDNKESLKEVIILLYKNSELREELALNGHKWVKKHRTWEKNIKKYISLYNSFTITIK